MRKIVKKVKAKTVKPEETVLDRDDDLNLLEKEGQSEEGIISEGNGLEDKEKDEMSKKEDELSEEMEEQRVTPLKRHYEDSDDSDEAPEEETTQSSKARTMEIYEKQKQAVLSTKRRKRKIRERHEEEDDVLNDDVLNILSENASVLSGSSTAQMGETVKPKRIEFTRKTRDLTENVEKDVDQFRLVSLSKGGVFSVNKPIANDILQFQRNHFYGKKSNRVEGASLMHQKAKSRKLRKWRVYCSTRREMG